MKMCQYCDSPIPTGYQTCPNCGRPVEKGNKNAERNVTRNKKKSTKNQSVIDSLTRILFKIFFALVAFIVVLTILSFVLTAIDYGGNRSSVEYDSIAELKDNVSQEQYDFAASQLAALKEEFGESYERCYESYDCYEDGLHSIYITVSRNYSGAYDFEIAKSSYTLTSVTTEYEASTVLNETDDKEGIVSMMLNRYGKAVGLEDVSLIQQKIFDTLLNASLDKTTTTYLEVDNHSIAIRIFKSDWGCSIYVSEEKVENFE